MIVSELCRPDVVTVKKEMSVFDAAKLMKEKTVGSLVVLDENSSPISMVTDRDIAIKVVAEGKSPHDISIADVMCEDLLILTENQDITEAIDALCEKGVRRAPVLDSQNQLCGIVTLDDVMACIIDELNGVMEIIRAQSKQFDISDMANQAQNVPSSSSAIIDYDRPINANDQDRIDQAATQTKPKQKVPETV